VESAGKLRCVVRTLLPELEEGRAVERRKLALSRTGVMAAQLSVVVMAVVNRMGMAGVA